MFLSTSSVIVHLNSEGAKLRGQLVLFENSLPAAGETVCWYDDSVNNHRIQGGDRSYLSPLTSKHSLTLLFL